MTLRTSTDDLLAALWEAGGSDLLLTEGVPPLIRVNALLSPIPGLDVLTSEDVDRLLFEVLTVKQREQFELSFEFDFSFGWRESARIRGNAFRQKGVNAVALRMIPREIPTMEALGLPPAMHSFAAKHQGLVLVTGPTGSGKSTTLASMIDWINTNRACHIITIEDPIEYLHHHKQSAVHQREVGEDTESFPTALRSALREDPDVLLVGEMRDLESIQFALTLAETGHLVFGTLHTNDTAQALDRIIDVFPAERQAQIRVQLANALTGIAYQRLLPRIAGGMVAAFEVLVANSAVRSLVKEGKTNQLRNSLITGQKEGMVTFEQSLSLLVEQGLVTHEEAVARSLHPKDVVAQRHPALRGT